MANSPSDWLVTSRLVEGPPETFTEVFDLYNSKENLRYNGVSQNTKNYVICDRGLCVAYDATSLTKTFNVRDFKEIYYEAQPTGATPSFSLNIFYGYDTTFVTSLLNVNYNSGSFTDNAVLIPIGASIITINFTTVNTAISIYLNS